MWTLYARRGLVAAVSMLALTAYAADKSDRPDRTDKSKAAQSAVSKGDRNFIMDAAQAGMAEAQLGKLAQERGRSDAVKQYGKRLEDDHGKANQQLMSIAQKNGVNVPASLDKKHQGQVDKFSKAKAENFDRDFAKHMVDEHERDIKKFRSIADKGDNAELKTFASQTVPVLEEHLKLARELRDSTKAAKRAAK